mmetsp:Transcript_37535/g.81712  ORF Transcript_37535/g.81712 Transcript_37535/m.81712 type:complete len:359 (-) Transcript_37535:209-1285(-)|eukprot:CAMPEP_0118933206 /NCGR_PEP_ID=MMETSP1169-20130426/11628_1 /TAXON_ID=36882 /ORGANISM="Pyramimonas obovata, Strain CCMP722" /LENGTH=358 /DNA_ID=CAMNT_0006875939 /DNA_START=80 /DNA_END=1156 /DNA_ORIENTATION=+
MTVALSMVGVPANTCRLQTVPSVHRSRLSKSFTSARTHKLSKSSTRRGVALVRADAAKDADPVICIGEVLWDGLPAGLFLGGAPVNVAQHMTGLGVPTACVSCVGEDTLGEEIRRRLDTRGVDTSFLQVDSELSTGFVKVTMNGSIPSYDIVQPSAWDAIKPDPALLASAAAAPAVIFGSLAQRDPVSRETIKAVYKAAKGKKIFDVNLRQPFIDQEAILDCMSDLYICKVNDEEIELISSWIGAPSDMKAAGEAYAKKFNIDIVCVTRGANGAMLYIAETGEWVEHAGYGVAASDTVGAGDSFLARLVQGLLTGEDPATALAGANAVGAFVATQSGATPVIDHKFVNSLIEGGEKVA